MKRYFFRIVFDDLFFVKKKMKFHPLLTSKGT